MNVSKIQKQHLSLRQWKNFISKSFNFLNHLRDLKTQKTTCLKQSMLIFNYMIFNQRRKSRLNLLSMFRQQLRRKTRTLNQQLRHQTRLLDRLHLFQLKHLNLNIHNEIVQKKIIFWFKIFETHVEKRTLMIRAMNVKSKSSQLVFTKCDTILNMSYLKFESKSWRMKTHSSDLLRLKMSIIIKYATIRDVLLFLNLKKKNRKSLNFQSQIWYWK